MSTKQDQAISAANQVVGLMQTFKGLRQAVNDFVTQYNSEGYATVWQSFKTAPLNADGSLGTADNSPNTANPVDTRQYAALQKAVSATQLVNGVAMLEAFQAFLTNSSVSTANRNQTVDDLAS